jgi:hypothetical protein
MHTWLDTSAAILLRKIKKKLRKNNFLPSFQRFAAFMAPILGELVFEDLGGCIL